MVNSPCSFLTGLGCPNCIEHFTSQGLQSIYHLQNLTMEVRSPPHLPRLRPADRALSPRRELTLLLGWHSGHFQFSRLEEGLRHLGNPSSQAHSTSSPLAPVPNSPPEGGKVQLRRPGQLDWPRDLWPPAARLPLMWDGGRALSKTESFGRQGPEGLGAGLVQCCLLGRNTGSYRTWAVGAQAQMWVRQERRLGPLQGVLGWQAPSARGLPGCMPRKHSCSLDPGAGGGAARWPRALCRACSQPRATDNWPCAQRAALTVSAVH